MTKQTAFHAAADLQREAARLKAALQSAPDVVDDEGAEVVRRTLRLDAATARLLDIIANVRQVPANRLMNEGLKAFAAQEAQRVTRSLEDSLAQLRAAYAADPGFAAYAADWMADEVAAAGQDPAEGQAFTDAAPEPSAVSRILSEQGY